MRSSITRQLRRAMDAKVNERRDQYAEKLQQHRVDSPIGNLLKMIQLVRPFPGERIVEETKSVLSELRQAKWDVRDLPPVALFSLKRRQEPFERIPIADRNFNQSQCLEYLLKKFFLKDWWSAVAGLEDPFKHVPAQKPSGFDFFQLWLDLTFLCPGTKIIYGPVNPIVAGIGEQFTEENEIPNFLRVPFCERAHKTGLNLITIRMDHYWIEIFNSFHPEALLIHFRKAFNFFA